MKRLKNYLDPLVSFWSRYERRISATGIAIGFVFDLIIADRPDSILNNTLLLFYLFAAGALIVILNLRSVLRDREESMPQPLFLLFILQICFGALASNLLVLYGRSGTLVGSALFVGLLAAMLIGNEFLKTRYSQLRFNIAVYYVLLFSYLILAIPTFILHSVSTWVFLASGLLSLSLISIFLGVLYYAVFRGRHREKQLVEVASIVFGIFLLFNGLYFLKVIPPVPLVLKDIGLYHSMVRADGGYTGTYEERPWWKIWRSTDTTFHTNGNTAYCFSSVFAPDDLKTPIYHRWDKKGADGAWVTISRVSFGINGGRAEGYRGFSQTGKLAPGQWRCSVETQNGALIGRISFEVRDTPQTPVLSTKSL